MGQERSKEEPQGRRESGPSGSRMTKAPGSAESPPTACVSVDLNLVSRIICGHQCCAQVSASVSEALGSWPSQGQSSQTGRAPRRHLIPGLVFPVRSGRSPALASPDCSPKLLLLHLTSDFAETQGRGIKFPVMDTLACFPISRRTGPSAVFLAAC